MSTFNNNNNSGLPQGATGPHSSRVANTADPRVDSDMDHRAAPTHTAGGLGSSSATTGTTGLHSAGGPAPNTDGPHKSDMMNKADPRVDSDRDYSKNMGMNPSGTAGTGKSDLGRSAGAHTATTGTSGLSSATHTGSTNHGTHNSNALNKADPRFDSDRDNRAAATGLGSATGSTNHGTHDSNLMNKADPRFDSDRDHRANHGENIGSHAHAGEGYTGTTGTTGTAGGLGSHSTTSPTSAANTSSLNKATPASTGPAPNTAGPHKSDMMNKMDPRVDSNLDGSKTIGGNKTFENA